MAIESFPTPRDHHTAAAVDGRLYAIGGHIVGRQRDFPAVNRFAGRAAC
jgi:hypothetical protein